MKLPKRELAVVNRSKVVDYLLSLTHADGRPKAAFFARFGFGLDNWNDLAEAIKQHAQEHEVKGIVPTKFGVRYIVEGEITGLDGRRPLVRAIWFIENGEERPRLVTAYPIRRR